MYIPKSKIETNLFSSGELVIESTGVVYYGPYFKTFEGVLYTGKEPNDGLNQILKPAVETSGAPAGIRDYRFTPKNKVYSTLTKQPKKYNPKPPTN